VGGEFPERAGGLLSGFSAGSRVAGYRLEEQVGAGGMAMAMATVFFGVLTAGDLSLLIYFLAGKTANTSFYSLVSKSLFVSFLPVYWLTGLGAVVLLWQRSSSDYYTAVGNRSKAIRAVSRPPHD